MKYSLRLLAVLVAALTFAVTGAAPERFHCWTAADLNADEQKLTEKHQAIAGALWPTTAITIWL